MLLQTTEIQVEYPKMGSEKISETTLQKIIDAIPLADFSEEFEFGREEKEIEVDGLVIAYTVSADLYRSKHGGNYEEPVYWATHHAYIEVDDLTIYDENDEEVEVPETQLEAITEQIKNTVEV